MTHEFRNSNVIVITLSDKELQRGHTFWDEFKQPKPKHIKRTGVNKHGIPIEVMR